MRVTIAGSGNVAESLARAMSRAGVDVVQVYARNETRGREVAGIAGSRWCGRAEELLPTDIVIIAVSDGAVAEVAASLPANGETIVAHTAGSVGLDAITAEHKAVFYPFMTFTAGREVDWRNIPLFLEASDAATLDAVHSLAERLSDRVGEADAVLRARIHLAGVFVNNFANAMFACASEIVRDAGLDFGVLEAIIAETAAKAVASGDPSSVQTGPAVRGDSATLDRHRALLAGNTELTDIYDKISEYIWQRKISRR